MQQGNGNICHYCRSAEAQCSCPRAFAGGHICTYLSHKTADEYGAIVKERDALRTQVETRTEDSVRLALENRQLRAALEEILQAGTQECLKDDGTSYPWEAYLLYHNDVSRYWELLKK